jgi:aminopeptidase N
LWGNNVSHDDIADMWIHESFGAYAEALFVEDVFGRDEALRYINGKKQNVRNTSPMIGERGLHRRGDGDMYDKGQLVLHTLRSVIDDDELWISILRGLQNDFRLQTVSSDQVFDYISSKAGRDLSGFFAQYFRHAAIPRLSVQLEKRGNTVTARHRWETDVENFSMPIKVITAPGRYQTLNPTTSLQTTDLGGIDPEQFKVPEDLFYVDVRIRRSYLNPGNEPAALP